MIFSRHKIKIGHFDPYNVILSIATNIPVLLVSVCVLQGHMRFISRTNVDLFNACGHCTEMCSAGVEKENVFLSLSSKAQK